MLSWRAQVIATATSLLVIIIAANGPRSSQGINTVVSLSGAVVFQRVLHDGKMLELNGTRVGRS
jgi:hypothetical protein